MEFQKLRFFGLFLSVIFIPGFFTSADIVYDSYSAEQTSSISIREIGNTVTLTGSKRFVTSFTVIVGASTSHAGQTNDYVLRFYLPTAPDDYPGKLLWQSPPKTNIVMLGGVQSITFDVPYIRVPETFIFSVMQAGDGYFSLCDGPIVGSSPNYCWTNLSQYQFAYGNHLQVKIEAHNRTDAVLLGRIDDSGTGGLGSENHYAMSFEMKLGGYWDLFGPSFTGITGWDEGSCLQILAADIPDAVDYLTNGIDERLQVYAGITLEGNVESDTILKSSGIAENYPDLEGCIITDIDLILNTIVIDHSTPDWTYFTWDVTWEIWGIEKSSDINMDRDVNLSDYSIFASAWDSQTGQPNWNPLCDLHLPEDNHIDLLDFQQFYLNWAYAAPVILEEDFETGDFSRYDWQHSGNANWTIVSGTVYEGAYASKSGAITHGQQSSLELEMDVEEGTISFFRKVSSEINFDLLRFYIDDVQLGSWSGEVNWSQVSFPVSAGTHVFKWSYIKDNNTSSGSDCAWIDNIKIE